MKTKEKGFLDWEGDRDIYDEDYPYDYFVLTNTEFINFTAPDLSERNCVDLKTWEEEHL